MVTYDGADVCEFVELYMLDTLTKEFGHDKIGLYIDDGLGCFQNPSGFESEKVKKIFKQSGLSITLECNLQIPDFLDVTFDLRSDKYYAYRKDNNQLLDINKHRWSVEECLIYLVKNNTSIKLHPHIRDIKSVASIKIFNSLQYPHQEIWLYGSIHHIVSMLKPTSVEYFYVSLTSNSRDIINTTSYSIENISRSASVERQIWQVSS